MKKETLLDALIHISNIKKNKIPGIHFANNTFTATSDGHILLQIKGEHNINQIKDELCIKYKIIPENDNIIYIKNKIANITDITDNPYPIAKLPTKFKNPINTKLLFSLPILKTVNVLHDILKQYQCKHNMWNKKYVSWLYPEYFNGSMEPTISTYDNNNIKLVVMPIIPSNIRYNINETIE